VATHSANTRLDGHRQPPDEQQARISSSTRQNKSHLINALQGTTDSPPHQTPITPPSLRHVSSARNGASRRTRRPPLPRHGPASSPPAPTHRVGETGETSPPRRGSKGRVSCALRARLARFWRVVLQLMPNAPSDTCANLTRNEMKRVPPLSGPSSPPEYTSKTTPAVAINARH
jgi:hypothetical protein